MWSTVNVWSSRSKQTSSRSELIFFFIYLPSPLLLITHSLSGENKESTDNVWSHITFKKQLHMSQLPPGKNTPGKKERKRNQSATQNLAYITRPLRDEITHTNPERSTKPSAAACFCTWDFCSQWRKKQKIETKGLGWFRGHQRWPSSSFSPLHTTEGGSKPHQCNLGAVTSWVANVEKNWILDWQNGDTISALVATWSTAAKQTAMAHLASPPPRATQQRCICYFFCLAASKYPQCCSPGLLRIGRFLALLEAVVILWITDPIKEAS